MADSDTTQQVPDTVSNSARQAREAQKKLAKAKAIIAKSQLAETPVDTPPPPKKRINYIITKALSDLSGILPRDSLLAVAKAMAKHVDSDGYPVDEVDNAEQSSANAE